ncbi:MAG: carboxymuconolactone decarboxylase family protein [Chloroflexi bacterium]|nr:carboxymuconolactone decarboxylase family protein [Chloroflexota bacterium]
MARVPYLNREDLPVDERGHWDAIAGRRGRVVRPFQLLLHSPKATVPIVQLGQYVRFDAGLDPVTRELAILATSRENRSQYEFTAHVRHARDAGVREEAINAIRDGRAPAGLTPEEALPVRMAQELVREHGLRDETYQAAVQAYGLRKAIDTVLLVGFYTALGMGIAALGIELQPGTQPELPA